MKRELRDYQQECCARIMEKFQTHQSTMAVLFTSGGKTVIFANIIEKFLPGRTLVIAGQDSLIWQAKRTIESWTGIKCGLEMNTHRAHNGEKPEPVVIATWQTLIYGGKPPKEGALFKTESSKRMHRFKPNDFDLIVIDEFHHAASISIRKVLEYFQQNPKIKILGVTATPKRGDGVALGEICQSVAFEYNILQGRENGWLVDIVQHTCHVKNLDYSHLKKKNGDLDSTELKHILEKQENVAGMVHPLIEVMFGLDEGALNNIDVSEWGKFLIGLGVKPKKTILFTASVLQAEMACEMINRVIPGLAEWVCGKTNKEERKEIFDRFENGPAAVLANVAIATEGYDYPPTEIIAMGRPTLSLTTFIQMLGRGTRVLPKVVDGLYTKEERLSAIAASEKPLVRVIDFKGNSGRHNLMTAFDVLGGKSSQVVQRAKKIAAKANGANIVLKILSEVEAQVEKEKKDELERKQKLEAARKTPAVPKVNFKLQEMSPFKDHGGNRPMPKCSKDQRPFSGPQQFRLKQLGVPMDKVSYKQASGIIGRAAANGWRLTPGDKLWVDSLNRPKPQPASVQLSLSDYDQAKYDYEQYRKQLTTP